MTLFERATQAEAKLTSLTNLDQRRTEVEKLEARRTELERELNALQSSVSLMIEYRGAQLPVQREHQSLQKLRERVASVATAFSATPLADTLTAGRRWTQLLGTFDKVTENCNLAAKGAWQAFVATECATDPPDALAQKLVLTPENRAALGRYREAYRLLTERIHRQPRSAVEVENIKGTLRELRSAQKAFNFDYPPDVAAFLRATQTVPGASLESLTESVLTWLQEHRMLGQFSVRPRT